MLVAIDPLIGRLARVLSTTPGQSHDLSRRFVVGQTLKGIVLRALPEGTSLVNFAGQHILLDLGQPMVKGQTFLATVEQSSPALVLKVVDDPAAHAANSTARPSGQQGPTPEHGGSGHASAGTLNAARLKSYLVAKQPFGDLAATLHKHLVHNPLLRDLDAALLRRLEDTLTALLPRSASTPDAAGLKQQIDRSGINYEAKVQQLLTSNASPTEQAALANDLKGQLLELLHRLEPVSRIAAAAQNADTAEVRQHVQHALQSIEFQQLANLFAHQEDQSLLLQFLHPGFPASHTAKLYFRANTRHRGANQAGPHDYTLVFLLDFAALGPIRVDATVRGPYVSATIRTEDDTVAHFITVQTPALTARLHDLGFQAEVRCCAQETVPLDIDDALTRLLKGDPSRLLDLKV
jgi:hypothetical protein